MWVIGVGASVCNGHQGKPGENARISTFFWGQRIEPPPAIEWVASEKHF
jgi:hypothetical protein